MIIQSLSVVVPGGCPNRCKFCVSVLHPSVEYADQIERNLRFRDLYGRDFRDRLAFARDNGCNTLMLTGDGEPLVNVRFLNDVAEWNGRIENPFRWIEIQTSGVTLDDEKLRWLRNMVKVSTISLSLSSIFESAENAEFNGTPDHLAVDIDRLCAEIKRYDFTLRLSLNLTDAYSSEEKMREAVDRAKALGADQITFRVLYESEGGGAVNEWIQRHRAPSRLTDFVQEWILREGRPLERLPFGAMRYSFFGMSVVVDTDCMSTEGKEAVKYLILRPNCKLYTKWDDKGSILF